MSGRAFSSLVVIALLSSACGQDSVATSPTAVTSPTTVTWTTRLTPNGTSARMFSASKAGTVTVTLENAATPVGIGIGVPSSDRFGCSTSASITALPAQTPQLATDVEPGDYCIIVFDAVGIETPFLFTLRLVYP